MERGGVLTHEHFQMRLKGIFTNVQGVEQET
jgi:hypothetical protein